MEAKFDFYSPSEISLLEFDYPLACFFLYALVNGFCESVSANNRIIAQTAGNRTLRPFTPQYRHFTFLG
jgi:hypothetical protein